MDYLYKYPARVQPTTYNFIPNAHVAGTKSCPRNITFWQKRGHILWEHKEFNTLIRLRTLPETC